MQRFCYHVLLVLLLLGFLLPAVAFAHKVNIFAYSEGGTVYSESYFPDGRPVDSGVVRVYDSAGQLLLEGNTDNQGLFQFKQPGNSPLTLEINASMGHKNSFLLKDAAQ